MPLVEFGTYLPDRPVVGTAGASVARNVVPHTDRSYGPFRSLGSSSNALTARCQGAIAVRASDGAIHHFAGDAAKLYKLASTTWSNVSKVGGYSVGTDDFWAGVNFGDRVIMTNVTDAIQSYVIGSSTLFSDLAAAAPKAKHIAKVEPGFVVVGNTNDPGDGLRPGRIWWCAQEDPTSWPTPGTAAAAAVQSDYQDLAIGGGVQQIIGAIGGASMAIFMESAIYRGDYTGDSRIFQFQDIERARGTPAPLSVINIGPFALYLGEDTFARFDGAQSTPIGALQFNRTFFNDANPDFYERITSAADTTRTLAFWAYCSNDATTGIPDRLLVYNWLLDRSAIVHIDTEILFRSFSQGLTLEDLDVLYSNLEAINPLSLDSRAFAGGRLLLSAFNTSHQMGSFEGTNLAATLETNDFDGQGQRQYVGGIRPQVDAASGVTCAVGYRDTMAATPSYTTATSPATDGICYSHVSARYVRARVSIAAGTAWTHAIGVEPLVIADGEQ